MQVADRTIVGLIMAAALFANTASGQDADALAKAAQNPLATMTTLPLQANWNSGVGPNDRTSFNLNIQPVIPIPGEKWNVITRTILPVNSVPNGATDSIFGLGDTLFNVYFSPNSSGKLTWGVGPVLSIPTATNPEVLGSGKWGAGITGVLFYASGKWTMGAVGSNVWSIAVDSDRADVNFLTVQPFINYNLGGGWAVGSAPLATANWEADSDNTWTIPLGAQISKITKIASQPVNLLLGYYDNAEHPDGGAESSVRFQLNFLFP